MKKEEAAKELLKQTKEKEETLHELLNQPLSFIQKALVDGLYTFYFDVLGKKPKIDEDAARQARETFKKYFPEKLEEMLAQLLDDPEGYQQKVAAFEKICPPVFVDFPTDPSYYRVIISDPSRQLQEVLTRLALFSNFPSSNGKYSALDVGTGYGRLARVIEDTLRSLYAGGKGYRVFGQDILEGNIEAAKKLNRETGSEITFFTRDMNQIPFPSDSLNLVNTTDASYLNFRHRRPFYIAEIARVLRPDGGVCCITNPNENTTLKEYQLFNDADQLQDIFESCQYHEGHGSRQVLHIYRRPFKGQARLGADNHRRHDQFIKKGIKSRHYRCQQLAEKGRPVNIQRVYLCG